MKFILINLNNIFAIKIQMYTETRMSGTTNNVFGQRFKYQEQNQKQLNIFSNSYCIVLHNCWLTLTAEKLCVAD